jgi:hypothetical protein
MRHKETFASKLRKLKRKKNECKSKTQHGRGSNDECSTHQDAKVPQEKGTRIVGSTSHLLPEPRACGFQGIERYDTTPTTMEQSMRTQQEAAAMSIYVRTLSRLVEATGDGKRYRQDTRALNPIIKPNEVYAVRCGDNKSYFRSVMLKKNALTGGYITLISNAVYGDIPNGLQEVSQEQIFKKARDMNAALTIKDFQAFPFTGVTNENF